MSNRQDLRIGFLNQHGWGDAQVIPLKQDASFRHYYRLLGNDRNAVLMDAPPEHEKIQPFLDVTFHLQKLEIRVPEILFADSKLGFILMEDLGDDTFTKLLQTGNQELRLYQNAIDVLITLQSQPEATEINLEQYDFNHFLSEALLFSDWYLPCYQPEAIKFNFPQARNSYIDTWQSIFGQLPEIDTTLVLRDYHVDNLMLIDHQCVVIDYQDALIGSPGYDVVSLLEDARRDISDELTTAMLDQYLDEKSSLERKLFLHHYAIWGAQRHCKVAGIFVRLWLRDNKPGYLEHLSRVTGLLKNCLTHPALNPLKQWLDEYHINLEHQPTKLSREDLANNQKVFMQLT